MTFQGLADQTRLGGEVMALYLHGLLEELDCRNNGRR